MEFKPPDYFRRLRRDEIFPNPNRPLEIDVGCGDGTFLLGMARAFPERDFLGIERLAGRVAKVCRKAERQRLDNVKVLRLESGYALSWLLPEQCASCIHLLFPDPWPKKRHAKHRFLNAINIAAIHRLLVADGEFRFKTDHPEYFAEGAEAVAQSGLFEPLPWICPDEPYPLTDFEQQWLAEGKTIQAARWKRKTC